MGEELPHQAAEPIYDWTVRVRNTGVLVGVIPAIISGTFFCCAQAIIEYVSIRRHLALNRTMSTL